MRPPASDTKETQEMQRNRAVVLTLVIAVGTWILVDGIQEFMSGGPERQAKPRAIGLATKDMPAGHRLVAGDFSIPVAGGTTETPRTGKGIGRILAAGVAKDQVIRESDLTTQTSGEAIANQLPPGYRAITITLRDNGPAVSLFPGALVDVLATVEVQGSGNAPRSMATRTVLERGRVLAVNDEALGVKLPTGSSGTAAERRSNNRRMTVTLAVTPEQASAVEFASARGTIGITVRADDDAPDTAPAVAAATPATGPASATGTAPAAAQPSAPAPAPAPAASDSGKFQTWDVLVIRGKDTERHSFANSPKPKAP
jgi:Flp pilus assembly protein CpaB